MPSFLMNTERPLQQWLTQQIDIICNETMRLLPSRLPDREEVAGYLRLLAEHADNKSGISSSALQKWAWENIGDDNALARDWILILRVLKQQLSKQLGSADFDSKTAVPLWWQLDSIITDTLIEVTLLSQGNGRSELLNHVVKLRGQMEMFEESKTNFITVAAHELRTPLTILEGYTNMLHVETDEDSSLRVYINGLQNGLHRLNDIIGDMIDISLMGLHSFELNYQHINLESNLTIITDQMQRHYKSRNIELRVEPFDGDYYTYVDAPKLGKAINKILMNALKFTPDGGHVTIRGYSTYGHTAFLNAGVNEIGNIAGYVNVEIEDNGIGIAPENLERIFNTFGSLGDASLHSSGKTKFKGGGAGLGLSITKGIIEAHGGRIWATSDGYNEDDCLGSTFHIELPIYRNKPESIINDN